jgi:hypothetical protein
MRLILSPGIRQVGKKWLFIEDAQDRNAVFGSDDKVNGKMPL